MANIFRVTMSKNGYNNGWLFNYVATHRLTLEEIESLTTSDKRALLEGYGFTKGYDFLFNYDLGADKNPGVKEAVDKFIIEESLKEFINKLD